MHEEPRIDPGARQDLQATARTSRRWFKVAIICTLLALAALGYGLSSMYFGARSETVDPVASTATGEPLTFAIGRTPGGQAEWANYVVLMRYVQERIGRPIRIRYIADREATSRIFENGEADAGFLCSRSFLLLQDKGLVKAIAVPVTSGASTETAMIFVKSESPFQTFEDLEGGSIAISSRTSVSGAAYLYWLAERKRIEVDEYFEAIDVSPTQEDGLRRLSNGVVDAAVGCSTEARVYPPGTFRAVAVSPEYALPPFVVSSAMDALTANALLEALLSFDAEAELPADSVLDGFVAVEPGDYYFTHELLKYVPEEEHK